MLRFRSAASPGPARTSRVKTEIVTSHVAHSRAAADEVPGVCAFLASDDAAYITRQTIVVDGGLTLYADFREPWSSE